MIISVIGGGGNTPNTNQVVKLQQCNQAAGPPVPGGASGGAIQLVIAVPSLLLTKTLIVGAGNPSILIIQNLGPNPIEYQMAYDAAGAAFILPGGGIQVASKATHVIDNVVNKNWSIYGIATVADQVVGADTRLFFQYTLN